MHRAIALKSSPSALLPTSFLLSLTPGTCRHAGLQAKPVSIVLLHPRCICMPACQTCLFQGVAHACRLVCWCGQNMNWMVGETHCGREQPRTPRGHKLQLKRIECCYCRCQRAIQLDLKAELDPTVAWRPIDRACPNPECARGFHGAECRKSGSDIVSVH